MSRFWLRALAIVLGLLTLTWIPVKLFTEGWNAPLTPMWIAAALGVTLLPPVALGALFLLVRKLANERGVTGSLRVRLRLLCLFTGPIGCVWSVFFLTREPMRVDETRKDAMGIAGGYGAQRPGSRPRLEGIPEDVARVPNDT